MATHLENLLANDPSLLAARMLDVGAGKGFFMLEAVGRGIAISGVEKNRRNIDMAMQMANERGLVLDLRQGTAEQLPFEENLFDFANLSEVLEHVADPVRTLTELNRVLKTGGKAYVSLPNRFGMKDPHFKLYFINWLPRGFTRKILSWMGRHKDYSNQDSGYQSLDQMHYRTFGQAIKLFRASGFLVEDLKIRKIRSKIRNPLLRLACQLSYRVARPWYFATHHYWLTKV